MKTNHQTYPLLTPGSTYTNNITESKPQSASLKKSTSRIMALVVAFVFTILFFIQGFAQTVVTNPASPWTVPAGVTSIKVEVWGGGGGGGGSQNTIATNRYGGGGGGGGYSVSTFTVAPGQTFNITLGLGGTVVSNAAGGAGGTTTVSGTAGTVSAGGGGGGARSTAATGGTAGVGNTFNGGVGGTGTSNGGGGGGGAGNAGDGGAGSNTAAGTGGIGSPNIAPYIGGIGGIARTNSTNNGFPGTAPGGGGGGGKSWWATSSGGAGAPGQVVITYTACPAITASVSGQSNISCFAGEDGTITITASGGTGSYQFSLDNGSTYFAGSNPYTFTDLTAGTYHPRVKDANGCESPPCP